MARAELAVQAERAAQVVILPPAPMKKPANKERFTTWGRAAVLARVDCDSDCCFDYFELETFASDVDASADPRKCRAWRPACAS